MLAPNRPSLAKTRRAIRRGIQGRGSRTRAGPAGEHFGDTERGQDVAGRNVNGSQTASDDFGWSQAASVLCALFTINTQLSASHSGSVDWSYRSQCDSRAWSCRPIGCKVPLTQPGRQNVIVAVAGRSSSSCTGACKACKRTRPRLHSYPHRRQVRQRKAREAWQQTQLS